MFAQRVLSLGVVQDIEMTKGPQIVRDTDLFRQERFAGRSSAPQAMGEAVDHVFSVGNKVSMVKRVEQCGSLSMRQAQSVFPPAGVEKVVRITGRMV